MSTAKKRLVSATSLLTSDKECLSDYDLEHLLQDKNGALWKIPGTKKVAPCTILEITGTYYMDVIQYNVDI